VANANSEYNLLSYVDISSLNELSDTAVSGSQIAFPNTDIDAYSFEEGDRIRFITKRDAAASAYDQLDIDDWSSATHDYEVVSFDAATNYIYFNSAGVIGDGTGGTTNYNDTSVIIEIYRPTGENETEIYYEVGPSYPVYSDSGTLRHAGGTADQTSSVSADGYITNGDAYLIARVLGTLPTGFTFYKPVFVESYSISDFNPSSGWGRGKAGAYFGHGRKTLNTVRYSNKYIKNTRSSSVGRFDGLDYLTMSYNYGDIFSGRQIGGVLKVIFENNVASILVNKTQFFNADGVSQVVKSDEVLGSINYSEEMWGSVNPESVLVVDRNLYFFDLRRKAFVRNAPNGSFPISDYKMAKYFNDMSDSLIASGEDNIKVYSAWDDDLGILFVGFNDDVDKANSEIIMFHEESNRWVGFVSANETNDKTLLTLTDENLGSTPDVSLATTLYLSNQWRSLMTALGNGAYSGTNTFTATDTITLKPGQEITIFVGGSQWNLEAFADLFDLVITGTGDVSSAVIHVADYVDNYYLETTSIEQTSTIKVELRMSGSLTLVTNYAARFDWYVSVKDVEVPVMVSAPSALISFIGEDLYLHNNNSTRCYFYGTQQEYKVRIYGGLEAPNIIKTFDSIALHTNKYWDITDIQIPATLNYPNGMQSLIPEARFEKEEGVLRSDYLCNMKSTSATASVPDLLNGDSLRGYIIYNDLEGDETTEHTLYKVDILMTQSKF